MYHHPQIRWTPSSIFQTIGIQWWCSALSYIDTFCLIGFPYQAQSLPGCYSDVGCDWVLGLCTIPIVTGTMTGSCRWTAILFRAWVQFFFYRHSTQLGFPIECDQFYLQLTPLHLCQAFHFLMMAAKDSEYFSHMKCMYQSILLEKLWSWENVSLCGCSSDQQKVSIPPTRFVEECVVCLYNQEDLQREHVHL